MKFNYLLAAIILPGFLWAQTPEKNKEVEQIIITQKDPSNKKLNIVVDGEKITVNGSPVNNNSEDAGITVIRRKIKDMDVLVEDGVPGQQRIIRRYSYAPNSQELSAKEIQPNKAMLGVLSSKADAGVEIMEVTEESAAALAGLEKGDIITEVDREKINTPDELSKAIGKKNPGDKVTILFLRNKKQRTAVAELKKREAPNMQSLRGFNMQEMPQFDLEEFQNQYNDLLNNNRGNDRRMFRFFGTQDNKAKLGIKIQDIQSGSGVKVIEVENGSDADRAGIKTDDVIEAIDGKTIVGTDDIQSKVATALPGNDMQVTLNRNGKKQDITVRFSKKIKTADL